MSRPSWSVPRGYSQLGRSKVRAWLLAIGLWGASTSAKIAATTSTTTMTTPTSAVVLRRSRRSPCASGDSERSARGQATSGTTETSATTGLPPLIGGGFIGSDPLLCALVGSGVPDARMGDGVRQVDEGGEHHGKHG